MMADDDDGKLLAFYRTLSTEQLLVYRGAMSAELEDAKRSPRVPAGNPPHKIAFCERRRRLLAQVLGEKGVEALN